MDLNAKIEEMNNEVYELTVAKETAHARIIELKSKIKKLTTLAKHAEEVFKVEEKIFSPGNGMVGNTQVIPATEAHTGN